MHSAELVVLLYDPAAHGTHLDPSMLGSLPGSHVAHSMPVQNEAAEVSEAVAML
jgi:hypothetical protein